VAVNFLRRARQRDPPSPRFFDPALWRIVLTTSASAGRSTRSPAGNTTQALVADIERLREARGVEVGGSLALGLDAGAGHTRRTRSAAWADLRGIFLGEDSGRLVHAQPHLGTPGFAEALPRRA
jgi:proline iminopeptidase